MKGLESAEARRRLLSFGRNELQKSARRSFLLELGAQFVHLFALLLWVAAILAWISDRLAPGQGMKLMAIAIVAVIVINGVFSFWQQFKAERVLDALTKLLPHTVLALRSGNWEQTPTEELVPGDVVSLAAGDAVPADCRVLESTGLRVNNASITGESVPESKNASDRNTILAGTVVVSGKAVAEVTATGMHTEFGKIAGLAQLAPEGEAPLQREVRKLSYILGTLATLIGLIFFLVGQSAGLPFWQSAIFAMGVIVANVPEGLLPTVTVSLAMAAQRMARKNALVRHLPAVQALGAATVICTDKTGTLTENSMKVRRTLMNPDRGGKSEAEIFARFCEIAYFCHDLVETDNHGHKSLTGDPMEMALVDMARPFLHDPSRYQRLDEIPFESDRKRLTALYETPSGRMLLIKGAPEVLLSMCAISDESRRALLDSATRIASEGYRVLGFACRPYEGDSITEGAERELQFIGLAGLEDPPRAEVFRAMKMCHRAGIRVIMVTGDHPVTAEAIARKIHLTPRGIEARFLTGRELDKLSDAELEVALRDPRTQFARLESSQKLRIVRSLRALGEIVAVTGDGVNDAPALKEADVGVAMGRTGADVARQSADLVLLDDHFATIVDAIEEGRATFLNVRKFLAYILTSNVPELIPYLSYSLFGTPLALSVLHILWIDLGTDMLPALALGAEKPEAGIMNRPPKDFHHRLVDTTLLLRSYLFLGVLEAAGSMTLFFIVLPVAGAPAAVSACLSAVIVMQMANVWICRSDRESIFRIGLGGNRLIWVGLILEGLGLLFVNYSSTGRAILGTEAVPSWAWPLFLACAILMIGAEELRKRFARRISGGPAPRHR